MKFITLFALVLPACLAMPSLDLQPRIIGGSNASKGQFKYIVSLQLNDMHFCGGSILSATKILTAAHCFGSNLPFTVVAGVTNTFEELGQRIPESHRIVHPLYNEDNHQNDIAILYIKYPLQFNQYVQPISLRPSPVYTGETLILSGWGYTHYTENEPMYPTNDLQFIHMPAIDVTSCQAAFGTSRITTAQVCTHLPAGRGACMGDSGGPLVDTQGQQVGVVSWGIPCAKGYPDVFTSVSFYYVWINNH